MLHSVDIKASMNYSLTASRPGMTAVLGPTRQGKVGPITSAL